MNTDIRAILDLLSGDRFPYPVAIFPDHDFELGPIRSVEAFDVPSSAFLDASEHLCELLWPLEQKPMILTGVVYDFASATQRDCLPADTVWYHPRRTHAQVP